jgi:prepilin-type N-terminal cleavage/methylation domain-containing protein
MICMSHCKGRNADAGLTLIEVLVVLSIIAVTTGALMLRLGGGRTEDDLTASTASLALVITAASDRALVSGRDERLDIGPDGYRVYPAGAEKAPPWQTLTNSTFADPTSATFLLMADGTSAPFQLQLRSAEVSTMLQFDGLRATPEAEP